MAHDRAGDSKRVPSLGISEPISHVAVGKSLNPGRINVREMASSGKVSAVADVPNKENKYSSGPSTAAAVTPWTEGGDKNVKQKAFNTASDDMTKNVKEGRRTKQVKQDDKMTNNYRRNNGLVGNDRPVVKINSAK